VQACDFEGFVRDSCVRGVLFDRRDLPPGRQRTREPDAVVPTKRADLQDAFRFSRAEQHVQQLAFFRRDVDRRQILGGVTGADLGENRVFSGEQLGDVALESLVHYAVASTFGKGGTWSSQSPAIRDCLSISTSMGSATR